MGSQATKCRLTQLLERPHVTERRAVVIGCVVILVTAFAFVWLAIANFMVGVLWLNRDPPARPMLVYVIRRPAGEEDELWWWSRAAIAGWLATAVVVMFWLRVYFSIPKLY